MSEILFCLFLTLSISNAHKSKALLSNPTDTISTKHYNNHPITKEKILHPHLSLLPLGNPYRSASPGRAIGVTWFEQQHQGSIGRMIGWGSHGSPDTTLVHFSWMYLPGPELINRSYMYRYYNITTQSFGPLTLLQGDEEYAGYVGLDVTNTNRAVIGGHNKELNDLLTDSHFYWDTDPGNSDFSINDQVPRYIAEYNGPPGQRVIWPKFRYVEGVSDTVLHVIAMTPPNSAGAPQAIYYFRRVGSDTDPNAFWVDPPRIIDTAYTLSHDLAADDNGKVALVWVANLPCEGDPCDTCSGYECRQFSQWDNDLYYQSSTDFGATWQPRVNITNNRSTEGVADSFRPFADLSALLDANGSLHIVWNARFWPADANQGGQAGLLRGKIFHWSENVPQIRLVHDFMWDQTTCNGGAWQLNTGKMSISECNDKLYVLFTQFNDGYSGIYNDCSAYSSPGYPDGAANGELYLTVSSDGGVTWDAARNLTNSRTPGCDSLGGTGGPCESDNWASMSRYGTNVALLPGDTNTEVVIPSGGTDNGWYLDVQYINDHSAGSVVDGEGFWQPADVRWFRLACVEPVIEVWFTLSPDSVGYPSWTHHGQQYDLPVTITNHGNGDLHYNISISEDNGPTGWLTYSGFSGTVPAGINNEETGVVHLNTGGLVNNPGTVIALYGRLIITSNALKSPDTFEIDPFIIADTLYPPETDTINTTCLSLAVSNNGSYGNEGAGKVNMDYVNTGDCDSSATVYLYDASPVVGWIDGNDTVMNWSIHGTDYTHDAGFVPVSNANSFTDSIHNIYSTSFLTHDSSIAFEKTWYAPRITDTCHFIIQSLRIWPNDSATHSGITLGEAVDWDIPSDSGINNGSAIDVSHYRVWQYGGEYHQDDSAACQDNDTRIGGIAFLGMFIKPGEWDSAQEISAPYGAYTASNAYFVNGNKGGFIDPSQLYTKMQDSGYTLYSNPDPDSQLVDLHTMMIYVHDYSLTPGDTLIVFTSLITVENGDSALFADYASQSEQWYCNYLVPIASLCDTSCCVDRGNADGQIGPGGAVDVADLSFLVAYLFSGGDQPQCLEQGNVDAASGPGGPVDVADLSYLVDFLFQGGPPPPAC